ncbi:MAG: bacillithiol biosynthesis deacetylase BshB1 [Chitinophagales bacterium]
MKLDILVFAAHPDDAELACGGTIAKQVKLGNKVGIIDLTNGELSSRGTVQTRKEEAQAAAKILGLSIRENLGFRDGFFEIDEYHLLEIIKKIRQYQPEIILCNAIDDRHPDHKRGGDLVERAFFLSGLVKIETTSNGENQTIWRPKKLIHYIQEKYIKPDFVVDISDFLEMKFKSIKAYTSQFYQKDSDEPYTKISGEGYFEFLKSRAKELGSQCGFDYAEGFTSSTQIGIDDIIKIK